MTRFKKLFLLTLIICCSAITFGQISNPLDQQNKPPTNSIFGLNLRNKSSENEKSGRTKNSITIPISTILHSEIGLKYERLLGSNFSLGFGISWSFEKDYLDNIFIGIMEESDLLIENIIQQSASFYQLQNTSKLKSGYSYEFFIRVYPQIYKDKNSYIDFTYKNKQKTNFFINNPEFEDSNYNLNVSNISLTYGHKWTIGKGRMKVVHELNYGLGGRFINWDNYLKYSSYDQWHNTINYYKKANVNSNSRPSSFMPFIVFRYGLGFGW